MSTLNLIESAKNKYFKNALVRYNFGNKWEVIKTYIVKNNISFPLSLATFSPYVKMNKEYCPSVERGVSK